VLGGAAAIEVRGLHKAFRSRLRGRPRPALAGLDLRVEAGGRVHGFLGPNGSGKTTTLRALVGLVRPDAGEMRVLGAQVPDGLPEVIAGVGALVEAPQFFRPFSGRRNLQYFADVAGVRRERVEEVLDVVDLTSRGDDPVKGYSLGMRQRLAIAAALLKEPRLLLLDEPSNGLDPAGIRDVRALLRRVADAGTTVVLSSHLLAEVEQVCDEVTIVASGRTITSGPVRDVLASADGGRAELRVRAPDIQRAQRVLTGAGVTATLREQCVYVTGVEDPGLVTRTLADAGVYLTELSRVHIGLEEAFLSLTRDEQGGGE
jgi:ABC-2 type transport system ATP-binding protein